MSSSQPSESAPIPTPDMARVDSVSPTAAQPELTPCPRCSTAGSGRFCTECGAPLTGAPCPVCGEHLTPGAKFCHNCGAAASGATAAAAGTRKVGAGGGGAATTLPWAVAGIAFLALFAMLAGKGFNSRRGAVLDAPQNALPNPALDNGAPPTGGSNTAADAMTAPFANAPFAGGGGAGVRAPDISSMTPQQIADRLFDRIMQLNDEGKADSVQFFAPMAVQAYEMVEQQQGHPLDADQRYDVGRIAEVAGALPIAKAEADTILQQHPDHLLGLLLAAQVAKRSGNSAAQQEYSARFAKVKPSELAKKLPEYDRHRQEITAGPPSAPGAPSAPSAPGA